MANQLHGARELSIKLRQLGQKMGTRALRAAMNKATTPVRREMRAAAPSGTVVHRTYKKRLVAPGFLKRNIVRKTITDTRKGRIIVQLGTRPEAFYGPQFFDQGPYLITQRKTKGGVKSIKAYTLKRVPFFETVFDRNTQRMTQELIRFGNEAVNKVK